MKRTYTIKVYGPSLILTTEEEIQKAVLDAFPLYFADVKEQNEQIKQVKQITENVPEQIVTLVFNELEARGIEIKELGINCKSEEEIALLVQQILNSKRPKSTEPEIPIEMDVFRETAAEVIDEVIDAFLEQYPDIEVKKEFKDECEDAAHLYGECYYNLESQIEDKLRTLFLKKQD